MSRVCAAARFLLRELRPCALVLLPLLCAASWLQAQCPSPEDNPNVVFKRHVSKPPEEEPLLPEAGYLSNTHYTSQFFGFGFDLPLTVQGHEIMMPIMADKQHALLALQYEKGDHRGYIMVTATDPVPGQDVNPAEQNEAELQKWANQTGGFGQQNPIPVPPFLLRSGRFTSSTHHHGRNYSVQYWAGIHNYMVKVVIGTNDQDFLHKAKSLMADALFYCTQDDGSLLTRDGAPVKPVGSPYTGPTVPTFRVNAALRTEPARNIPEGESSPGVYRNAELGLQYQMPSGWAPLPPDKSDPPPADPSALRIYRFLHACSQTLLTVAPPHSAEPREQPAPMIVLRALDPNCLSMRTPTSLADKRTLDAVAASLEEMTEFGQIATDDLVMMHGHLFMVFHGTLATAPRGEDLGVRMSQTIYATRYNKTLLMWSVIAADRDALAQVPVSSIVFDGSPPIELHTSLPATR